MKRVLSDRNGVKTTMEIDGDKTLISKSQNISAAISFNKAMANERGKKITSDAYNHVALIPPIFQIHFLKEHGIDIISPNKNDGDQQKAFKDVLNSSDYRFLRTNELKL